MLNETISLSILCIYLALWQIIMSQYILLYLVKSWVQFRGHSHVQGQVLGSRWPNDRAKSGPFWRSPQTMTMLQVSHHSNSWQTWWHTPPKQSYSRLQATKSEARYILVASWVHFGETGGNFWYFWGMLIRIMWRNHWDGWLKCRYVSHGSTSD